MYMRTCPLFFRECKTLVVDHKHLHLGFLLSPQANPPKPSDAAVYIEDRPALDVYVKAFGGWAVGDKYLRVRSRRVSA